MEALQSPVDTPQGLFESSQGPLKALFPQPPSGTYLRTSTTSSKTSGKPQGPFGPSQDSLRPPTPSHTFKVPRNFLKDHCDIFQEP